MDKAVRALVRKYANTQDPVDAVALAEKMTKTTEATTIKIFTFGCQWYHGSNEELIASFYNKEDAEAFAINWCADRIHILLPADFQAIKEIFHEAELGTLYILENRLIG